jgi:hypothetical protein
MKQKLALILLSLSFGLLTVPAIAEDTDSGPSVDSTTAATEPASDTQAEAAPSGSTDTAATDASVAQAPATESDSK